MKLKVLGLLFTALLANSCSVEKTYLSPTSNMFSNLNSNTPKKVFSDLETNTLFIKYSSEITNSRSSLISFSNKDVEKELSVLNFNISEYIYAIREYNTVGKEKALYNYEKSYKKVQKLKNKLSNDEEEILNRFLIKTKTNIALIESLKLNP